MTVRTTPCTPFGAKLRLWVTMQEATIATSRLKRAWRTGDWTEWATLWCAYIDCCRQVAEAETGLWLMSMGIGLDPVKAAEIDEAAKRFSKCASGKEEQL